MRDGGGPAWFSTISGQIGWYSAEPAKNGGEGGNHYSGSGQNGLIFNKLQENEWILQYVQ
jgi:hypothetical protein